MCTLAAAITAGLLTTAFTTLVTPTNVLVNEYIGGSELDFNSSAFWHWVNMHIAFCH